MLKNILNTVLSYIYSFFFSTHLYGYLISRFVKKFNLNIVNFNYLDALYNKGHIILEGKIPLSDKKYSVDILKSSNLSNNIPESVFAELHSFAWLIHLKSLGTPVAKEKAIELIETWMEHNDKPSLASWNFDVLSNRVFNWIICYSFLFNEVPVSVSRKILSSLSRQIMHLKTSAKMTPDTNNIKITKALVATYVFYQDQKDLIKSIVKYISKISTITILSDGGDVSRSPEQAFINLEDLICIYYLLKDHGYLDLAIIRDNIDKITVFIRSIRTAEGVLPIFYNGGALSSKYIAYILSLSKVSTDVSNNLRNSGYLIVRNPMINYIVDLSDSNKLPSSLLSYELLLNKKKVIGNLDSYVDGVVSDFILTKVGLLAQTHSDEYVRLTEKADFLSYSTSDDDFWDIIRIKYEATKEHGLTYYSTIHFSKNHYLYILGEEYLRIEDVSSFKKRFKRVFLNLPLDKKISNLSFDNPTSLKFSVKNRALLENYIFSSVDNPICLYNLHYNNRADWKVINSNILSIDFNLDASIIKNEWTLANLEDAYRLGKSIKNDI